MLFALPDENTLYAALLARDPAWDGRAWVCVTTTGIFCRLTCPTPKPKQENVRFHDTPGACLSEGYRPCKRCHPLGPAAQNDPVVAPLLAALEAEPSRRWREQDILKMGLDPSTVRRAFRRNFGITFLDMARQRRLVTGIERLGDGDRVIDAQLEAGFDSPSAFRDAVARLLGVAPGQLVPNGLLRADWIETPLGQMIAVSDASALLLLEFSGRRALPAEIARLWKAAKGQLGIGRFAPTDQAETELAAYFAGQSACFTVPLAPTGTPFQHRVWTALRQIPAGETCSYADVARDLGQPTATRAVARANGANPIALIVPCHRVIGADGSLTGYGGGLWRKQRLIEIERQYRTNP